MALILKRKPAKAADTTTKPAATSDGQREGTPPNFLADANETSAALPPEHGETRVATGPKKLVIKGKKTAPKPAETPDKAVEPPVEPVEAPNKAVRPPKIAVCQFCRYERRDPCHGSNEWRGSTDKDGNKLECADKRLVKRLRAQGKDQFGQPLNEQRERDAKDDCAAGLHSWTDVKGKLDPSCECRFCGELYGEPE